MDEWHLIPWTVQYLASSSSIIIVSAVIFSRNRGSLAYQNFFAYGFCTAIWEIMAFLHRSAPTAELSKLFFSIDLFFVSMSWVFLPLTILCIRRERKAYFWLGLPAFTVGMYVLLIAPFEIFWSDLGWSFKFTSGFGRVFYTISILYLILLCFAFIQLARKTTSKMLVRKYLFAFISYFFFCGVGIIITTLLVQRYPDFPPFGGILTLTQFLFIAYAVSLKPENIMPYSALRGPIDELSQSYITFLNRFQAAIPGQELGESSYRFQDYVEAMGMENIVVSKSGTLVFEADKLSEENVSEVPDSIIRLVKEHPWAEETTSDFVPIIVKTYQALELQSKSRANEWLKHILQSHGGFLVKHGMLTALSKDVQLPTVFTELKPGQAYLLKEDTPKKAYDMLRETEPYGIECLCITKLSPQTLRERYGIRKAFIHWVTFEKAEATTTPKDMVGLTKTVSEFLIKPDVTIFLLDCLDQIKFANGFDRSLDLLKDLRALSRENNSTLIISIPPMMFEKKELVTIEKELEEGLPQ